MLEKQLVSLTCNFTGRPKVNVTWSYGNQINGTSTLVYDDSSSLIWVASSLNITFVPKICKNYTITCTGENQFGTAEQSTVLKVTGKLPPNYDLFVGINMSWPYIPPFASTPIFLAMFRGSVCPGEQRISPTLRFSMVFTRPHKENLEVSQSVCFRRPLSVWRPRRWP